MEYLRALLKHMNAGAIFMGADQRISHINPRAETLLGLTEASLEGQNLNHLIEQSESKIDYVGRLGFGGDDLYLLLQALRAGQWQEAWSESLYELNTPSLRYLRRKLVPIPQDGQSSLGLLMLFEDDSPTHELRRAQDEIASMIVHDLRSPLTAVSASLRLLRELAEPNPSDPLSSAVLQMTGISGRALRKVLNLVNSLLDVSRMENGLESLEREPTRLREIINLLMAEFAPLAAEMEVHLSDQTPFNLPLLDIDAEKIERVLYNLIDNALKFTPADGAVWLEADLDPQDSRFVCLRVIDSGAGVPDVDKPRLFNRFEQATDGLARRRGTGIGLTYCRLTVEAHGGQIWIEDQDPVRGGTGAVFAFTLPIDQDF